MTDNKVQVGEMVPVLSKIAENKLNGTNYLDWSKTVRIYMRSIDKDDHLSSDPPTDDTKRLWLREDARLILQIRNSIDSEILGLINHCEFVKELMDYLEFLYSGKGNISRIYDVCRAFYRPEKETKTLTAFFMDFKKTYEELNMLLPFSKDIKVQQAQREQMAAMSFLGALPPEFDTAKSQILSGTDITSLQEVFSRVLRTESTFSNQQSSVLVANRGRGSEAGRMNNNRGDRGGGDRGGHNGGTSDISVIIAKSPAHKAVTVRNYRIATRELRLPLLLLLRLPVHLLRKPSQSQLMSMPNCSDQESVNAFAESGSYAKQTIGKGHYLMVFIEDAWDLVQLHLELCLHLNQIGWVILLCQCSKVGPQFHDYLHGLFCHFQNNRSSLSPELQDICF
ncbi:hypothetical protein RJ640_028806 [Escallonia rubra]|uniref:Gag-pol polyprotein n=1 Tax=Escallonia rubra TaxID=112253 RepID=A0AA88QPG2_9ASTE|nr:hypothetical protein RJ640_028806 [Escallonia rubra]